jgi:hypothetical protein
MSFSRRNFLKSVGMGAVGLTMVAPLEAFYTRVASGQITKSAGYGPLSPKLPENVDELRGVIAGGIDLNVERKDVIRVETNLIINDILVTNKNGGPVRDLKINDFIVREDGRTQEISTFSFGGTTFPRLIVLIMDYFCRLMLLLPYGV